MLAASGNGLTCVNSDAADNGGGGDHCAESHTWAVRRVPGGRDGRNGGVGPQRVSRPAESRDVRRWRIHGWIPRGVRKMATPRRVGSILHRAGRHVPARTRRRGSISLSSVWRSTAIGKSTSIVTVWSSGLLRAVDKPMARCSRGIRAVLSSKWTQNPTCKWPMRRPTTVLASQGVECRCRQGLRSVVFNTAVDSSHGRAR